MYVLACHGVIALSYFVTNGSVIHVRFMEEFLLVTKEITDNCRDNLNERGNYSSSEADIFHIDRVIR